MSRECPVTHAHCHNTECNERACAFEFYPFNKPGTNPAMSGHHHKHPETGQPINIYIHYDNKELSEQLHSINKKIDQLMAKFEEVQAQVTALQTSLDAKQEQIAAAIAAFEQTIKDLQDQITNGGGATPEQLQTLLDQLTAAKADLEATPTA